MIWKSKGIRRLVTGLVLPMTMFGDMSSGLAQDLAAPSMVMDDYLYSLVTGDTLQLAVLTDGPMKNRNHQLTLSPETYSRFLKDHYAGVQTSVEGIMPDGAKMRARVRFDYPTSDSSIIEFVLTKVDEQWKITDEEF